MFNEHRKLLEAETQQRTKANNFEREQNVLGLVAPPQADQTYHEEQDNKADLLKWQQDIEDELLSLVMTLKGMGYDSINKEWVEVSDPICGDAFIYEVVIPQCKPFFSRNLINSNYTERDILMMLRNTMDDIADAMADAWAINTSKYKIKFTDHDLVIRLIKNSIKSGPYRALKGWTKKTDSSQHKSIEMRSETGQEEKPKRLMGFINT